MTGFEFHLTHKPVKKIKHLAMQKSEKRGRIYVTLQPHATRTISVIPPGRTTPPRLGRRRADTGHPTCTATGTALSVPHLLSAEGRRAKSRATPSLYLTPVYCSAGTRGSPSARNGCAGVCSSSGSAPRRGAVPWRMNNGRKR